MVASLARPGFGAKFYYGDGGVGAGTQASKTIGTSNQQLRVKARYAGTAGNSKTFGIVVSGLSTPYSQVITANSVLINSATDGAGAATTTVLQAIAQLMLSNTFVDNFQADVNSGNGSGVLVAGASASLTGGANGAEVFTEVAEVLSIPGVGITQRTAEVTNMGSPNGWAEHIATGIKEGKPFTLPMNFVANAADQILLFQTRAADGTKNNYRIQFTDSDPTTLTFPAIVTETDIGHEVNSQAQGSVTFMPCGEHTWA